MARRSVSAVGSSPRIPVAGDPVQPLCQQFTTWYDGEAMCFDLIETGRNSLKWIRNNGQTGTARTARACTTGVKPI